MNKTLRIVVPGIAAAAMAASLTACGSSGSSASSNNSTNLNIGGSTAQGSAESAWIKDFQGKNASDNITYNGIGSGDGRKKFESGEYAFAGSDSWFTDDAEYAKAKSHCATDPFVVPVYVSPIAVGYNLPGLTKPLNLDATTIAGLFDGKITKWNDAAIATLNPGVSLPSISVQPVHRSDSSGTTKNFTDYLSKAGNGAWAPAASSDWPSNLSSGLSGASSGDIAQRITGTAGAVGYLDASKAKKMGVASIEVAGTPVAPSAAGAKADLAASKVSSKAKSANQLFFDVDRTPTSAADYPLLLVSYAIGCDDYAKAGYASGVGALVKSYLTYVVSEAGQLSGSTAASSAPLPANVAQKAQAIVATIK